MRLPAAVLHHEGGANVLDRPGRREAGDGHSIFRLFRRLSPFPLAGLPVVAGDSALDHFVAPAVACNNEGDQITTAEAKRSEAGHDHELQQITHCSAGTLESGLGRFVKTTKSAIDRKAQ